jgi:hypothetical protein
LAAAFAVLLAAVLLVALRVLVLAAFVFVDRFLVVELFFFATQRLPSLAHHHRRLQNGGSLGISLTGVGSARFYTIQPNSRGPNWTAQPVRSHDVSNNDKREFTSALFAVLRDFELLPDD